MLNTYELLPEYSRELDIKKDYGAIGETPTLKGYLDAIDSAVFEPSMEVVRDMLTLSDLDNVDAKYLPYIAYTLGYDWNYYLDTEIQRTILKNILEIYKRKGTKFSIHFSLYQLDKDISIFEPYKEIFTVNRSGLNYNIDFIDLWSKNIGNAKKIDIDSDGYIYVLNKNGITKYKSDEYNIPIWVYEDDKIVDFCMFHNGVQRDILYILTTNKEIFWIKVYNEFDLPEYKLNKLDTSETTEFYKIIEPQFIRVDSNDKLIVTGKNNVVYLDVETKKITNDKLDIILEKEIIADKEVIKPTDFNGITNVEITNITFDSSDNIILSHKGFLGDKYSESFVKRFDYKIDDITSEISYILNDNTKNTVFGYSEKQLDGTYDKHITINKLAYNLETIYCLVNNRFVYSIDFEEDGATFAPVFNSKLHCQLLSSDSNEFSNDIVKGYVFNKEYLPTEKIEHFDLCYTEDDLTFNVFDGIDKTWVVGNYVSSVSHKNNLPKTANKYDIYYVLDTDSYFIWETKEFIEKTLISLYKKDNLPDYSNSGKFVYLNDIYEIKTEEKYYKWINEWVEVKPINQKKEIVLTDKEYPDNECLSLDLMVTNIYIDPVTEEEVIDQYEPIYSFNKETKTITLENELLDTETLDIKVYIYDSKSAYEIVNEKESVIDLTKADIAKIIENGALVFFNYKKANAKLLTENKDYDINYNLKNITIKKDIPYGTVITILSDVKKSKVDPENIDHIIYYNELEILAVRRIEKSLEAKVDSIFAKSFMNATVIKEMEEIVDTDTLYKLENTNNYYMTETIDGELVLHKVIYDICIFNKNGRTSYTLADTEDCVDEYRVYRNINIDNNDYGLIFYHNALPFMLGDEDTVKIKLYDNYRPYSEKQIVNNELDKTSEYNLNNVLFIDDNSLPTTNFYEYGFDVYVNNVLIDSAKYNIDLEKNCVKFNFSLEPTDIISIFVWDKKYQVMTISVDNTAHFCDYILIGLPKAFMMLNRYGEEIYTYNTVFPITDVISKIDTNKIYFMKNDMILCHTYLQILNGGVLTDPEYYSNGVIVLKSSEPLPKEIFDIVEFVRPAGWKLVIEGKYTTYYNNNSKTYKDKYYQELESSDEKDNRPYPINALDIYKYDEEKKEIVLDKKGEYEFISATLDEDNKPEYKLEEDMYRKTYTTSFANVEDNKFKNDTIEFNFINVFDSLSNKTKYYAEQLYDSIQYSNSNNGEQEGLCMLGKTWIVECNRKMESLENWYESMFHDIIISEDTQETTNYRTLFRNAVHFCNINQEIKEMEFWDNMYMRGNNTYTFTIPEKVNKVLLTVVGGGGGASPLYKCGSSNNYISLGGAGADFIVNQEVSVSPGNVVRVTIGKGGEVGHNGEDTTVTIGGNTFTATGGKSTTVPSKSIGSGNGKGGAGISGDISDIEKLIYEFDAEDSITAISNHVYYKKQYDDDGNIQYIYTTAGGASYGHANGYKDYPDNYGAGGCYNLRGVGTSGFVKLEWK